MIVWRTGQIECLANDSSCHPFKNADQELKVIFVVFEAAKASVIFSCWVDGGEHWAKATFAGKSII